MMERDAFKKTIRLLDVFRETTELYEKIIAHLENISWRRIVESEI
jgi:hypothetical protein